MRLMLMYAPNDQYSEPLADFASVAAVTAPGSTMTCGSVAQAARRTPTTMASAHAFNAITVLTNLLPTGSPVASRSLTA